MSGPDLDREWASLVLRLLKAHGHGESASVALYTTGKGQQALADARRRWEDWAEDEEIWQQIEPALEAVKE